MNLEKKAAIIGAIWGLVSVIVTLRQYNFNEPSTIAKIIVLSPMFLSLSILSNIVSNEPYAGVFVILFSFSLSILIGALISYGIAKIYLNVKGRKKISTQEKVIK